MKLIHFWKAEVCLCQELYDSQGVHISAVLFCISFSYMDSNSSIPTEFTRRNFTTVFFFSIYPSSWVSSFQLMGCSSLFSQWFSTLGRVQQPWSCGDLEGLGFWASVSCKRGSSASDDTAMRGVCDCGAGEFIPFVGASHLPNADPAFHQQAFLKGYMLGKFVIHAISMRANSINSPEARAL